ncbi:Conidiation protein 6-domain-containing protein [Coprinopsis sp. MPI-PUGE-AT-0042]|nr:Conidiation protein 6-domain-containing protein [Coprinopsis sp. MPI-PUGE-AT-0042]
MSTQARTHEDNVVRGPKAALNNPRVSDEAKAHDRQRLREMGQEVPKDRANVIRGLKAAIHNPRVSKEAKERDLQRLREMGEDVSDLQVSDSNTAIQATEHEDEEHMNRVLGGYNAALANPNVGDEAKARAEVILKVAGELETYHDSLHTEFVDIKLSVIPLYNT